MDVYDVVVRVPKTLSPDTSVAQARSALDDRHVHMLLITDDDGRLLGTLVRNDLLEVGVDGAAPALDQSVLRDRTIAPDAPAEEALQLLLARGERRLAVVDRAGRLVGLLCLKRRLNGFCSDADVLERALHSRGH